jgi:hypothetical protein
MSGATYSQLAFALLNLARVVAYVPQVVRICTDPNGARAVSPTTWGLFTAANVATVSYALAGPADIVVAGVFTLNALGCFSVTSLTIWKRFAYRATATEPSDSSVTGRNDAAQSGAGPASARGVSLETCRAADQRKKSVHD